MLAACLELIHNLLVIVKRCYLQSENIVKCYIIYNHSYAVVGFILVVSSNLCFVLSDENIVA